MTDEQKEQAVLGYLTADTNSRPAYRSLTTIFEQFTRSREWRSSFFEDVDDFDDDKEALRVFLDQMVADGLLEAQMGDRDYEMSYRASDQGTYESAGFDQLVVDEAPEEAGPSEALVTFDSSAWTGLTKTVIDARNAKVVSGLIDKALESLPSSQASNFHIMQASAYLKAAKELVDAPEPPSQEIWRLIGRAADIVGLLGLFLTIFAQVAN